MLDDPRPTHSDAADEQVLKVSSQPTGERVARCSPVVNRPNLAVMDPIEMLAVSSPPDLTWRVMAGGSDAEFSSMLEISRSGRTIAG